MHNGLLKVENETRLFRDASSKAIINKDDAAYERYMLQRKRILESKNALEQNTQDIAEVKQELSDIKNMLAILIANSQK